MRSPEDIDDLRDRQVSHAADDVAQYANGGRERVHRESGCDVWNERCCCTGEQRFDEVDEIDHYVGCCEGVICPGACCGFDGEDAWLGCGGGGVMIGWWVFKVGVVGVVGAGFRRLVTCGWRRGWGEKRLFD